MEKNLKDILTSNEQVFKGSQNQEGMQFKLLPYKNEKDSREAPAVNSEGDCVRVEDVDGNTYIFKLEDSIVCRPVRSNCKALPFGDVFLAHKTDEGIAWRHCSPWMDKKNRFKVSKIESGLVCTNKGVFEIASFVSLDYRGDMTVDSSFGTYYAQVRDNKVVDFQQDYK